MSGKRIFYGKWLRRCSIVVMGCWAAGLLTFFTDPEGTREQLRGLSEWLADKQQRTIAPEPCTAYETVAWQLMDTVEQYWQHSFEHGLGTPLRFIREIQPAVEAGKLVELKTTPGYVLDTMHYSFPFAVPAAKQLMDTIAARFQEEIACTDLAGTRLRFTSVLRTQISVEQLVRYNRNAIRNSAHLHGTTFDVSYASYDFKRPVEQQETEYLREALARTLYSLREEARCWVTYEIYQTCFHVVTRTAGNEQEL